MTTAQVLIAIDMISKLNATEEEPDEESDEEPFVSDKEIMNHMRDAW